MMMKLRTTAALLATTALLAACGGGGTDTGYTQPVNAAAAWQNLFSANRGWTLTGTGSDGYAYTINMALNSGGLQTFPLTGAATQVRYWDLTTTVNGTTTTSRSLYHLEPSQLALAGTQAPASGVCGLASASVLPPTATAVGTSGIQAQMAGYANCSTSQAPISSGTVNWAVAYESGITYLCTSTTIKDTAGAQYFEEDCFETSTLGQIGSKARIYMRQVHADGTAWSLGLRTL